MAGVKGRSGRRPGFSPINKHCHKTLKELNEINKRNVLLDAIELIYNPETTIDQKIKLFAIVMPYIEPRKATIEVKADIETRTSVYNWQMVDDRYINESISQQIAKLTCQTN